MKHIVIIGSALSGNKCAAAMLESSIQTLGDKETKFTLLSMYPKADAEHNTYQNLEIVDASPLVLGVVINSLALLYRLLPFLRGFLTGCHPAIKALSTANVLLDQGGITFVDGREKFLIYNIASILPAINMKVPVVKCAQALGPFHGKLNRVAARIFLPKMSTIISRGRITHQHLENLGLNNVIAGADYAFALDVTKQEAATAQQKYSLDLLAGKKIVGLSPSVVMRGKVDGKGGDYLGEMVKFVDYLTDQGYGVMLVPHSVRSNTDKTHNNDLPLCREIYAKVKHQDQLLFLDQELASQELRYWIGRCDYFVASRFHAMVSSLAMGVPTLVIGWSHKYREVLEMFELEQWAFGQDKLNQDHLRSEFNRLVASESEVRASLKQHLPQVKKDSLKQAAVIRDIVNGNTIED